jgi:hypothetical protein
MNRIMTITKEPVVAGCRSRSAAECGVNISETQTCFVPDGHPVRLTCLSALQWRILAWTSMWSSFLDCAVNSTPRGARVTAPPARTACGQGARAWPGARRRAPATRRVIVTLLSHRLQVASACHSAAAVNRSQGRPGQLYAHMHGGEGVVVHVDGKQADVPCTTQAPSRAPLQPQMQQRWSSACLCLTCCE